MITPLKAGTLNSGKTILLNAWRKDQHQNIRDCYKEKANKRDWDLRQELNDDKLWKDWMSARRRICYHYKSKHFGQGTVKPLMIISCEMRLNSESTRYCLNGEDKQCG